MRPQEYCVFTTIVFLFAGPSSGTLDSPLDAAPRWGSAAGYALAWFPAAVLGLYLKHAFMEKEHLVIARALGRDVAADITAWEALSFYRADILLSLVLIPLGLALLLGVIPDRYRVSTVITISGVFVLFFFVNLQTLGNVGRYMSIGLLFDSIRWGIGHPAFIDEYVPSGALLKLSGVLLSVRADPAMARKDRPPTDRSTPDSLSRAPDGTYSSMNAG